MSILGSSLAGSASVAGLANSIPVSATAAGASAAASELLLAADDLSELALIKLAISIAKDKLAADNAKDKLAADNAKDKLAADNAKDKLAADNAKDKLAADNAAKNELAADLQKNKLRERTLQQRLKNLSRVISDEAVSRASDKALPAHRWKADRHTAWLVHAAATCSSIVYLKGPSESLPGIFDHEVKTLFWANPTWDGAGKTAALFQIEEQQVVTIVAAVRGSSKSIDWAVNFDKDPMHAPDLLKLPESTEPVPHVHRGFVKCAQKLLPLFKDNLQQALDSIKGRKVRILFTGHSAGGAVAALLFCHFVTNGVLHSRSDLNLSMSCITFGAPPMITTDITPHLQTWESVGVILFFVNNNDPIPRMDHKYASKLLWLFTKVEGSSCITPAQAGLFGKCELSLHGVGQLVMIYDMEKENGPGKQLTASLINHEYLQGCIWGDFTYHKMTMYLERAGRIAVGDFNGEPAWSE